mgnify:CR=1 FL=1
MGRAKAPLVLSEDERQALQRLVRRQTIGQRLAFRARIVLLCASGMDNDRVALEVGVRPATVGKWRKRFVTRRLDGLLDEPRSGTPRKITDEQVEAVVVRTLETMPPPALAISS